MLNLEGEDKSKFDTYRQMLIDSEINLLDICEKEDLILTTANIAPLSHWITSLKPEDLIQDFFIAYLPENQIVQHDGMELTHSLWISPNLALKKALEGEMQMILPTTENPKIMYEF